MTPDEFSDRARTYCAITGGSVTSWGRTTTHNAAVGGVPRSAHRFWLAVDVVYDAPVAELEAIEIARRLGLRVIREDDHDHVQPLEWPKG
jgi:hypothetical protein